MRLHADIFESLRAEGWVNSFGLRFPMVGYFSFVLANLRCTRDYESSLTRRAMHIMGILGKIAKFSGLHREFL